MRSGIHALCLWQLGCGTMGLVPLDEDTASVDAGDTWLVIEPQGSVDF